MASSLWNVICKNINGNIGLSVCGSIRHGHHLRGKPPGVAKSLETKLAEANYKDPSIHYRVDIGLPPPRVSRTKVLQDRLKLLKEQRKNTALEKLARDKKLLINLEETHKEWLKTAGPQQIKQIGDHYGVFEHLFGDAYFYPRVPLNIYYETENGDLPVYFGNIIKPADSIKCPKVLYDSDENILWTLTLVNPDGHFTENSSEYIHWCVTNIPGSNIENGETIIEYLQPFPPKGIGYHRMIFILYKQDKKLDLSSFKKEGTCLTLSERTFNTYDFYKQFQDNMTPAGLAFYQSDWDKSLKDFYHHKLNMKEPIFEYDFPPPYIKKQKWFPIREPFNLYMDKYRDPKQINKEFFMRKMKNVHPFKAPPPPLPYPNAVYFEGYIPSWLKLEIRKSRLKWGRINDIE
ncbi:39S ribosomal protein L38, mitochondrial [Diorhabda carinulata]|uniref:39S ribosomal protein L38, mitochondrial n=1 Tax=Diorhabda carinulata TaxID=1163345 RepID=UPI0025A0EE68|nr:39S ribosomal protein L38, mitochondrial [Diorhabda carinulata]